MSQEFLPFHPNEVPLVIPGEAFGEHKYSYALQSIIFYTVHVGDDTLTYYKEGIQTLDPAASGILHYLLGEFETFDFHQRYWHLREWVAEHVRKNPGCNVEFTQQTYKDLVDDLDIDDEVEEILNNATHEQRNQAG